ncbi:hypothetical protein ACOSQ4_030262 [Xanthoceras sorbifolium]
MHAYIYIYIYIDMVYSTHRQKAGKVAWPKNKNTKKVHEWPIIYADQVLHLPTPRPKPCAAPFAGNDDVEYDIYDDHELMCGYFSFTEVLCCVVWSCVACEHGGGSGFCLDKNGYVGPPI